MDKTIINKMYSILPEILIMAKKSVWFDYDKEADVLYVSFQHPQRATETTPFDNNILLRRCDKELVGLTILQASKLAKTTRLPLDKKSIS